jgi:L-aspartate oxidase
LADLAPRDVVAAAITRRMAQTGTGCVWLDATAVEGFAARFPTVTGSCRAVGIDPTREPIPVTPAAHYACGGVVTDVDGRTAVPGLYAAGEVARTGLHGANRLASNSLAEALVFGRRSAIADEAPAPVAGPVDDLAAEPVGAMGLSRIRDRADRFLSVRRDGPELQALLAELAAATDPGGGRAATLVAWLMAGAADRRRESRGGHYRVDFPAQDPDWRVRQAVDRRGWWRLASPETV